MLFSDYFGQQCNTLTDEGSGVVSYRPWDISKRVFYYTDFLGKELPNEWHTYKTGTGAGFALQDSVGGILRVNSGTGYWSWCSAVLGDDNHRPWTPDKKAILERRVRASQPLNQTSTWFGFARTTNLGHSQQDKALFRLCYGENVGQWRTWTADGSNYSVRDTSVDPTSWHTMRIELVRLTRFGRGGTIWACDGLPNACPAPRRLGYSFSFFRSLPALPCGRRMKSPISSSSA